MNFHTSLLTSNWPFEVSKLFFRADYEVNVIARSAESLALILPHSPYANSSESPPREIILS